MPIIKQIPKKNLWETICKEYETKQLDEESNENVIEYDPAKHSPVYFGYVYNYSKLDDETLLTDYDSAVSNPACYGYSLELFRPKEKKELFVEKRFEPKKLTEREYIEQVVFPILLPSLELMLAQAKLHKCFERKRTAFNACDFITEYLYKNNPYKPKEELDQRKKLTFNEIPFVKEWFILHPRAPLPKSLIWTEEEASAKIQAFVRGYLVRRDPEVQELRKWQRELREENQNIVQRVEKFWNDTSSMSNSIKNKTILLPDRSSSLSIK